MLSFWVSTDNLAFNIRIYQLPKGCFRFFSTGFDWISKAKVRKNMSFQNKKKLGLRIFGQFSIISTEIFEITIFLKDHRIENISTTIIVRPIYPSVNWLQFRSSITSCRIYRITSNPVYSFAWEKSIFWGSEKKYAENFCRNTWKTKKCNPLKFYIKKL